MGIRALELARALAREFDVHLLVPNGAAEAAAVAGSLSVVASTSPEAARIAPLADAAVVSGHAANAWFRRVPSVPVAADLYDPFMIENLHYAGALGPEPSRHDRQTLALALSRADFFLCASSEQRLFYAGALYEIGRIGPQNFPEDPELSRLVGIVPFGVSEEPARGDRAKGRHACGLPVEGPLVLFGGVYDWNDPAPLLEAWAAIRKRHPRARLLFFESPNPETTPQRAYGSARETARRLDPAGASIVFAPWRPYGERADLYAASDVLVSISAAGLESDLAFRTRLLDAAWGGVPSVSVGGGPLSAEMEAAGAGRRVPRDPAAIAHAVVEAIASGSSARDAARRFAEPRTWRRAAQPLVSWCRDARVDPHRLRTPLRPDGLWRRLRTRAAGILRGE